jgi:hypothetical protein
MLVDCRDEVPHLCNKFLLVTCDQTEFWLKVRSTPDLKPFGHPGAPDNPVDQVDEIWMTGEGLLQALLISAPPVRYVHALTEPILGYYYSSTAPFPVITTGKNNS